MTLLDDADILIQECREVNSLYELNEMKIKSWIAGALEAKDSSFTAISIAFKDAVQVLSDAVELK